MMIGDRREPTTEREPIRWFDLDNQQIPVPFLRVTTCGLLTLEVVDEVVNYDPPQASYHRITSEELHGRGVAPALTLLKLLLSRPQRFATKAWLTEQFCREEEAFACTRIDNIVSHLRSLLCAETFEALRKQPVTHVRSSAGGGNGYQLASYPLIWTDVDALDWNVEQATRMERFGDDPLPYWERVYTLAKRGIYLPDEIYNDWSATRRDEVAGILRQSVQALARLYPARHGQAGEEEALSLLRNHWLEHPREEDVLRPLMELLGKRDCYQEALEYYGRLCEMLAEEQLQPDEHTRDVMAYVRNKKIQRKRFVLHAPIHGEISLSPHPSSANLTSKPSGDILVSPDQFELWEKLSFSAEISQCEDNNALISLGQSSNRALLKEMVERNFPQGVTYNLLSSNIKTMNFRDEWQYVVNNLVAETKTGLRAMVFDVELTRWWNSLAGQAYMMTNMELLKRRVPIRRIFILSSFDARLRMNALLNAYVHHKIGIDVKVCTVTGFQNSIPFTPDMFSVHDNQFVTLYYFSPAKPLTNLLLEDKYISEFRSFYDELFQDDRLCADIETILADADYGESFRASSKMQLDLLLRLEKIGSTMELARNRQL